MDIDEAAIGQWPNVAIEAGADLKAMKPEHVENRSVFDEPEEPEATPAQFAEVPKDILNGESYKLGDTRELRGIARAEGICLGYDGATKRGTVDAIVGQRQYRELMKEREQ